MLASTSLYWRHSSLLLVILSLQVTFSGAVIVVGTSARWANEGSDHSVTCMPSEAIQFLRWYKSSIDGDFADAQNILQLFTFTSGVSFDPNVNQSHYSFNKTALDYPLTVKSVDLDDKGRYWCEVEISGQANQQNKAELEIRRKPSSIQFKHLDKVYTNGQDIFVIAETENKFECIVPGIIPAAKFSWTLGTSELTTFDERNSTNGADLRLVDSYSTLTTSVSMEAHLICSAQNAQDGTTTPDQTITVMLKIRVPPDPSTMFLAHDGMRYKHGDSINVTAGFSVAFSCTVPGIKPEAEIFNWTLGSTVLFPESNPTSVPNQFDSMLYDTTSALTFTVPGSRTALTCAASNRQDGKTETESSISVTLVIRVPPDPSTMFLTHDGMRYKHGDSISVTAGCTVAFSCTVPGIKPAAEIFYWTLGSTVLFPESDPTSVPNQVNSRLYDTTSALTFTVPGSRMALMCAASNRQDGKTETESSISVTLAMPCSPFVEFLGIFLICVGVVLIIVGVLKIVGVFDFCYNKCIKDKKHPTRTTIDVDTLETPSTTPTSNRGLSRGKIVGIILIVVGVVLVIIGVVIVVVCRNKRC